MSIRVGVLGAKGYAAGEAIRWLLRHPEFELTCLMGRLDEHEPIEQFHPDLRGATTLGVEPVDMKALIDRSDVVVLGLPHTSAQEYAKKLLEAGRRVVDLSADFRLDDVRLYEKTYGVTHLAPELNDRFIYALPELFGDALAGAEALACPGCYPTASLLALAPLIDLKGAVDLQHVVIDALSGVSGAGRKVEETYLFSELNESMTAYNVARHRHRPEIEEKAVQLGGSNLRVTFTPHLIPITRGMIATVTVPLAGELDSNRLNEAFASRYGESPFVRLLGENCWPKTASVLRSNFCDLGWTIDHHARTVIVVSAIDNLAKGAASQAVQAMNLMYQLPETLGLWPSAHERSHV